MAQKVCIFSNRSGSGHKETARVLNQELSKKGYQVTVCETYEMMLHRCDFIKAIFGISAEDFYNVYILQKGNTGFFYKAFFFTIYFILGTLLTPLFLYRLHRFLKRGQYDHVISVIPLLNRHLNVCMGFLKKKPPFYVLITDFFEHVRGTWFIKSNTITFFVGNDKAYLQGQRYVGSADQLVQLSGMVIDPKYAFPTPINRDALLSDMGFVPSKKTALFVYGGFAPNYLPNLLDKIRFDDWQYIVICGDNNTLKTKLSGSSLTNLHVTGYVSNLDVLMQLADVVVGKGGPGVMSQAMTLKKPMLIDFTNPMDHEKPNVYWALERHVALHFDQYETLAKQLSAFLPVSDVNSPFHQAAWPDNKAVQELIATLD